MDVQKPSDALLQLCTAQPVVPTHTVADVINNGEAWHQSFDDCAAHVCRLVQWYYPLTICSSAVAPAPPRSN